MDELAELNINVTDFDIDTAAVNERHPQFLKPVSLMAIDSIEKKYRLRERDDYPDIEERALDSWDWTMFLSNFYELCLKLDDVKIKREEPGFATPLESSKWELRL